MSHHDEFDRLAGLTESDDSDTHHGKSASEPGAPKSKIVESVMEMLESVIDPTWCDYTEAEGGFEKFMEDIEEKVVSMVASELGENLDESTLTEGELTELTRVIMKRVGTALRKVRQKLSSIGDRRKRRLKYKRKKAHFKKLKRRQDRKALTKKSKRLRKVADKKARPAPSRPRARTEGLDRREDAMAKIMERVYLLSSGRSLDESASPTLSRMKMLLVESKTESKEISEEVQTLADSFSRLTRVGSSLASFFEAFGTEEDREIAMVLTAMIESIESKISGLMESDVDVVAYANDVQRLAALVFEAYSEYAHYKLVESDDDIDESEDEDDDVEESDDDDVEESDDDEDEDDEDDDDDEDDEDDDDDVEESVGVEVGDIVKFVGKKFKVDRFEKGFAVIKVIGGGGSEEVWLRKGDKSLVPVGK